jgi:hypothetical protein
MMRILRKQVSVLANKGRFCLLQNVSICANYRARIFLFTLMRLSAGAGRGQILPWGKKQKA